MADEPQKPPDTTPPSPPEAAADKPAGEAPGEPLKGEVSRTDSPGAGVSATAPAEPRTEPPAPKPENPAAAQTATTADPLPSWNDGAAKQTIIEFVQATTTQRVPSCERR